MKKIFLLMITMLLVFLGINSVSSNYTYETNNYTDYRYVEYYNYDDGYRIKHYVLYSDNTRNVGRTELYKNGNLIDSVDTVFFSTGRQYLYWDMIGNQRYSKIKQIIRIEDKIEIYYEYKGPNGILDYPNKNIFYIGGKKEIDDLNSSISVFGSKGKHFLVKLNLKSNGEIISSKSYYDSLWENTSAYEGSWVWGSTYFGTMGCTLIGLENKETEYKINYKCIGLITSTSSSAGGSGGSTIGDIFPSFTLSKEEYSLCNYNEEYCEQQPIEIPTPTNLNQYIIPATLEEIEEIQVGSKIGKFQSGSGVIFEAEIDNPEGKELRLNIELYKKGETITKQNYTSDYFTNSGKVFTKILLSEGDYYWNIKIEDTEGNASEWKEFGNNGVDTDFSIFEGFEPYPYGFKFVNGSPTSGMLTGTYDIEFTYNKPFYKITEDDGRKWKIFDKAFDTRVGTGFEKGEIKRIRAYESLGLNNDITFINNGSCFGLSALSLLKYQDDYFKSKNIPNYLEQNYNRLYTKIKNGNIYDLISNPSSTLNQNWDTYSDDLEDIFSLQLFQYNKNNY
ncbi:hypothetical protein HUU51_04245, partial [Candidatus Gracilibacteria bacterium]|nr:hypothetical protein [Candidatus Gracilibacteria bacterium]